MAHLIKVTSLRLPCTFEWEDKEYVAACDVLGVATSGETMGKARDNLTEALGVYLDMVDERGDLERVLKARRVEVRVEEEIVLEERHHSFGDVEVSPSVIANPEQYIVPLCGSTEVSKVQTNYRVPLVSSAL